MVSNDMDEVERLAQGDLGCELSNANDSDEYDLASKRAERFGMRCICADLFRCDGFSRRKSLTLGIPGHLDL